MARVPVHTFVAGQVYRRSGGEEEVDSGSQLNLGVRRLGQWEEGQEEAQDMAIRVIRSSVSKGVNRHTLLEPQSGGKPPDRGRGHPMAFDYCILKASQQ